MEYSTEASGTCADILQHGVDSMDAHQKVARQYSVDAKTSIDHLGHQNDAFLSKTKGKFRMDIATGDTPRKRQWPDFAEVSTTSVETLALAEKPVQPAFAASLKRSTSGFKVLADKSNSALTAIANAIATKPDRMLSRQSTAVLPDGHRLNAG